MFDETENPISIEEQAVPFDPFATPLSCATIPPEHQESQSRFQLEYLKLEVVELKELLILLASKYKISEDKRRHLDQRNNLLLQENIHLNSMANIAEKERSEAVEENRSTLAKLKEFLNFKDEFHRQAHELRKALRKKPKQKTKATSMTELVSTGASGDASDERAVSKEEKGSQTEKEESRPSTASSEVSSAFTDNHSVRLTSGASPPKQNSSHSRGKDQAKGDKKSSKKQSGQSKAMSSMWKDKADEAMNSATTVKSKLMKANQEIHTLKNMNDWKTSQLEQKASDLQRKKDELAIAHKEIVKLRGLLNKLTADQAAVRYGMKRFVNLNLGRCRPTSEKSTKEANKLNDPKAEGEPTKGQAIQNDTEVKILQEETIQQHTKQLLAKQMTAVSFETSSENERTPQGSDERLQRLWYLDPVEQADREEKGCRNNAVCA